MTFISYYVNYLKLISRAKKIEDRKSDGIISGDEKKVVELNVALMNTHCKSIRVDLFIAYIPMVSELISNEESPYLEATKEISSTLDVPFLNLIPVFKKGLTDGIGTPYFSP